jgi:hypothetical protein
MTVIRSHSTRPIPVGSRTHSPLRLISGNVSPSAVNHPVQQEPPARTRERSVAQRNSQLARALARNPFSRFTGPS